MPTPIAAITSSATRDDADRPSDGKLLTATTVATADFPPVPTTIAQQPAPGQTALDALYAVALPVHDYFAAAEELGRVELGERVVAPVGYQVSDRITFHTAEGPRQAELVYRDELADYWVEVGAALDQVALAASAERLRRDYYPLLSQRFGNEWRPGIDGDPRLTVLHVLSAAEAHELGYFTDENEFPRAVFAESNEREMVILNVAQLAPDTPLYDGTLVHEIQHLIQWNLDANEDKWLNEGLSQVAEALAGLDTVDPRPYLEQTHVRLDRWSDATPEVYAHYSAAYLYLLYFQEQIGDAALSELARHPANGLAAVRAVLAGHRPDLSLETFTADWATALYLDGVSADPRFNLRRHELPDPFFANRVRQLPFETVAALEPYAVDYIDLDFSGRATITFAGDTVAPLLDAPPVTGPFWYAPPANSSRVQLSAAVDLTGLSEAALTFSTWYDLEPGYDFTYLSVSTDGGETWQLLEPGHAVLGAYGPAWGGRSMDAADQMGGWVQESIDLSAYAGRAILLRFDATTDFEGLGQGFAVQTLAIPQLAEQPEWRPDGFVETGHLLPQRWAVRLIRDDTGEAIPLALDGLNRFRATVELGAKGGALVITPLMPFAGAADYWLAVEN